MNYDQIYARLAVVKGAALRKGQPLYVSASVEVYEFVREVVAAAYEAGAGKVTVAYDDACVTKARFESETKESVENIDEWEIAQKNYIARSGAAYLRILSDDPDAFAECDGDKITALSRARHRAFTEFYDMSKGNAFKWCLIGYPSEAWAAKVFPGEKNAYDKLKDCIFRTMRVYEPDPFAAWDEHCAALGKRCEYLNAMQFDEFEYTNASGTDLRVGMPENYVFSGGGEYDVNGDYFIANMPTEEVFSAPHRLKVNGTVRASMPLVHDGKTVRDFWFTFKDGKVASYGAKEGKEVLDGILGTDEGANYLGEIAMVGYDTPIRMLDTLFYNTLYDENASCHFALGAAYPTSVAGGEKMSKEEQDKAGLNYSLEHVDFMVGTADLKIVGIKDGKRYPIFIGGNFVKFD